VSVAEPPLPPVAVVQPVAESESRVCVESGPDTERARPLVVPPLLAKVIVNVTVLEERLGTPWDDPLRLPLPEQAANAGAAAATVTAGTAHAAVTPVRTTERRPTWARASVGARVGASTLLQVRVRGDAARAADQP
jgi:hypothetical protein